MYTEYFGLREKPFNITPDPRIFFPTPTYQRAYANLLYGVCERKGLTVLTGEVGTGKTTLLRRLMKNLGETVHFIFFYYTTLTFDDLLDFIWDDLQIPAQAEGRLRKVAVLREYLYTRGQEGLPVALLIDEVQNLNEDVLSYIHLLLDLDADGEKLLPLVLVGQPEFEATLTYPAQAQLHQRVALHCRLDHLKSQEVGPFILHRLQAVGCRRRRLFEADAVERIAIYSQGIPRLINVICDNALLIAYSTARKTVSAEIIEEVAQDLRLQPAIRESYAASLLSTDEPAFQSEAVLQKSPAPDVSPATVPLVLAEEKPVASSPHKQVQDSWSHIPTAEQTAVVSRKKVGVIWEWKQFVQAAEQAAVVSRRKGLWPEQWRLPRSHMPRLAWSGVAVCLGLLFAVGIHLASLEGVEQVAMQALVSTERLTKSETPPQRSSDDTLLDQQLTKPKEAESIPLPQDDRAPVLETEEKPREQEDATRKQAFAEARAREADTKRLTALLRRVIQQETTLVHAKEQLTAAIEHKTERQIAQEEEFFPLGESVLPEAEMQRFTTLLLRAEQQVRALHYLNERLTMLLNQHDTQGKGETGVVEQINSLDVPTRLANAKQQEKALRQAKAHIEEAARRWWQEQLREEVGRREEEEQRKKREAQVAAEDLDPTLLGD